MEYTVRPISDWTPFGVGEYTNSPFTVTWSTALDLLGRELDMLDACDVVLELACEERHIRVDGGIRADATLSSPAVRLAFDSAQGPLVYATDEFVRASWRRGGMEKDWQHNVYAIALGLEALRKLDRYGITRRGEQYTGWKALPAGRAMPASHMSAEQATTILREQATRRISPDEAAQASLAELHKQARRAAHPDHNAGDHTLWDQVEAAALVLGIS